MKKLILRVQCSHEHCRGKFTIRVDISYSGRRMRIECPRCFGKLIVKLPEVPKDSAPDPSPDKYRDPVEEETILTDMFKTGERFVTGAHETVKDLLGNLKRDMGAD